MHSPGISRQAEGRQKKEKHSKQTFPGIRFGELSSSKNSMKKLNIIFHTISEIDRIYSTTYKIHVLPCVFEETTPPETAHFKVIQNNSSPECLKVEVDLSSRCLFFFSPTFFHQRSYSHSDACHREQTLVLPFNRHQPLPPPFTFPSDTHTHTLHQLTASLY